MDIICREISQVYSFYIQKLYLIATEIFMQGLKSIDYSSMSQYVFTEM